MSESSGRFTGAGDQCLNPSAVPKLGPGFTRVLGWAGLMHVFCPKTSQQKTLPRSKVTPDGYNVHRAKKPKTE